ncbi:MAG: hypothetical protein MZV63_28800 [Marinilabiliales bacterium]|nr:hypothetical protein [Marinilabiliales bacterium]
MRQRHPIDPPLTPVYNHQTTGVRGAYAYGDGSSMISHDDQIILDTLSFLAKISVSRMLFAHS